MDRPDPSHPLASPARRQAAERLLRELAGQLESEELALEEPGFDELAAAAEGTQDEPGRLLWAERVARDPELAERAAALAAFCATVPTRSILRFFPRRPAMTRWGAPLAAAAALLVALLLRWANPTPVPAPVQATAPPPPAAHRILFADGFESGSLRDWTPRIFVDGFESGSARDWTAVNSPRG
jgi:hypothetical protein